MFQYFSNVCQIPNVTITVWPSSSQSESTSKDEDEKILEPEPKPHRESGKHGKESESIQGRGGELNDQQSNERKVREGNK